MRRGAHRLRNGVTRRPGCILAAMVAPPRGTWVLPMLFALVTLSLPAQMLVASRVSEPFPGLFMPKFASVPDVDGGLEFNEPSFKADGQPVALHTLFGAAKIDAEVQRLARRTFPREPDGPVELSPDVRAMIVDNLSRATGQAPRTLEVTWKRRRYDVESRRTTDLRTISSYEVMLGEAA